MQAPFAFGSDSAPPAGGRLDNVLSASKRSHFGMRKQGVAVMGESDKNPGVSGGRSSIGRASHCGCEGHTVPPDSAGPPVLPAPWRRGRKLTGADAESIRRLLSQGCTFRQAAEAFGVSRGLVSGISSGAKWKRTTGARRPADKPRSAPEPASVAGCRWVPLTKGKFALVDERFFPVVSARSWRASSAGRGALYAAAYWEKHESGASLVQLFLHRYVWMLAGNKEAAVVDHINGDRLDCRLANLRACTTAENSRNRVRPNRNSTTGFKGVSRVGNRYLAHIGVNWKKIRLGVFADAAAAARAYDAAALRYHGAFSALNFPEAKAIAEATP